MSANRVRHVHAGALAVTFFLLSACEVHVEDDGVPMNRTFHESEPNDSPFSADPVGAFWVGQWVRIRGDVTDFGADLFDGFAFASAEPCDVSFVLASDSLSADLDLCVYDPVIGGYAFCFETPSQPEVGTFHVPAGGMNFQLVVASFAGSSDYTLDVFFDPLTYPATANADATKSLDPSRAIERGVRAGRAIPVERYFRGGSIEERVPRVRERAEWIEIDLRDGSIRTHELELVDGAD